MVVSFQCKVIVSLMNLSAPALVAASHMPAIMHVVGYLCSDNVKNLALALMPVYSYTRNYLWKEEAAVMEWISGTQAACDKQWFLQFLKKCVTWPCPSSCVLESRTLGQFLGWVGVLLSLVVFRCHVVMSTQ